jgi:hypothetical protein
LGWADLSAAWKFVSWGGCGGGGTINGLFVGGCTLLFNHKQGREASVTD